MEYQCFVESGVISCWTDGLYIQSFGFLYIKDLVSFLGFVVCLFVWQIQELVEAIVLPMTHKERFQKLGIRPPKGVLLYGPPGTGKTLMARACAAQTNATFLKLAGPQLVQVSI